jgi:hypothetical protein
VDGSIRERGLRGGGIDNEQGCEDRHQVSNSFHAELFKARDQTGATAFSERASALA